MHTPEADALLAAILAAPDDDAPRLVFADWLDEHHQADRAAFIRLQIELAGLPKHDPRREVVARRGSSGGAVAISSARRRNRAQAMLAEPPVSSSQSANTSRGVSSSGLSWMARRNASKSPRARTDPRPSWMGGSRSANRPGDSA